MIVRRSGGLTEFIPSPQEKREGTIRDHALDLLGNLDARLRRLEEEFGLPDDEARAFGETMARVRSGEEENERINLKLADAGVTHGEGI